MVNLDLLGPLSPAVQQSAGLLTLDLHVTQDLFLSVGREFGQDSSTSVGLEYSVNRRLKVRGSSSDQGETAVDFLWRLDY